MNREEILNNLKKVRNGAYTKIRFISTITSNKNNKNKLVQKVTESVVRLGVTYAHIEVVKASGKKKNEDNFGLPWGQWDPNCSYLIEHKGKYYLRCSTSRSPKHHANATYYIDGVECTKEEAAAVTNPGEWNNTKEMYVFTPNIENILALGKGM